MIHVHLMMKGYKDQRASNYVRKRILLFYKNPFLIVDLFGLCDLFNSSSLLLKI